MVSIYSFRMQKLQAAYNFNKITIPFRLLLFSDGSLTRHLQILSGYSIRIMIIKTSIAQLKDRHGNYIYFTVPYPQISRQIWLVNEKNVKVVYANSIWNQEAFNKYLTVPKIPIGKWIIDSEIDVFRYIYKIEYIYSINLENHFKCKGPFWTRYYFLIHDGEILASIQEVFSSNL